MRLNNLPNVTKSSNLPSVANKKGITRCKSPDLDSEVSQSRRFTDPWVLLSSLASYLSRPFPPFHLSCEKSSSLLRMAVSHSLSYSPSNSPTVSISPRIEIGFHGKHLHWTKKPFHGLQINSLYNYHQPGYPPHLNFMRLCSTHLEIKLKAVGVCTNAGCLSFELFEVSMKDELLDYTVRICNFVL